MLIKFVHDRDTELPHIYQHGVSEDEVFEVFRRAPLQLHGREGTMLALGQSSSGRYLKIVYRQKIDHILIITAYDLRGKELIAYRRRRRRYQE